MDATPLQERRAVTRLPGSSIEPVRIRLDGGETLATVHDISIAGIGIVLPQQPELGTWLVLAPGRRSGRMSPELRAEVRQTTKRNGDYLVGCRFSRLLTIDDLLILG